MFTLNIPQLISNYLRPSKRTPIRLAWFNALSAGIEVTNNRFTTQRVVALKKAKVKGTKVHLDKLLNESFNTTGIEIINLNPEALVFIGSTGDGHTPVYMNDSTGVGDLMIGDNSYYHSLADFEVQIPAAVFGSIDQNRLRAILAEYIFSTLNYNIISK